MLLWILTTIASGLLSAASSSYFFNTKFGLWANNLIDKIASHIAAKYGLDLLEIQQDSWKRKNPEIAKKIKDIETRLETLEKKNAETRSE